ncbi:MAG TPA: hypothetical protein VJB90_01155 [Candidatus Nanoarchaeia archaeon]|nr:hypothetical protein [Candidatus Nanoarchaeia archaeon]
MERRVSDKNILNYFAEEFCKIVERHTRYIIVSGFVAIASGRARGTEDIDMIIPRLSKEEFYKLHNDLLKNKFICMQSENEEELYGYLKDNLSIRYTWKDKPIPEMEIKFAKDEIDNIQLSSRVKLPLTGLDVWFSTISANIAFKEEYLKSPKDLEDAKHLRIVYAEMINEGEIKEIKKMLRKRK